MTVLSAVLGYLIGWLIVRTAMFLCDPREKRVEKRLVGLLRRALVEALHELRNTAADRSDGSEP
jgi:hypothetical protein